VDVEPDAPLEPPLWKKICTPDEIASLLGSARDDAERGRIVRLVFAAKEATYKAVYPLVVKVFGFHKVELAIDWDAGRFTPRFDASIAALIPPGAPVAGRFARRDGFVFAAATSAARS
jgi:4'-phosphopantetheinyl transferase EntD